MFTIKIHLTKINCMLNLLKFYRYFFVRVLLVLIVVIVVLSANMTLKSALVFLKLRLELDFYKVDNETSIVFHFFILFFLMCFKFHQYYILYTHHWYSNLMVLRIQE
jgi:hypothetical protein